tara:strand:- start:2885 stop:3850 length:966 start_codon:yes stop_codon:yes gene_type:complete
VKSKTIPSKSLKENGSWAIRDGIKNNPNNLVKSTKKPKWLRVSLLKTNPTLQRVVEIVNTKNLNTVCEEAKCPNLNECWSHGTATFMLLGSVCTRACKFCAVDTGNPKKKTDKQEPARVARSVASMKLKYVVLTSVNRDDLDDGGAAHFSETIKLVKRFSKNITVEALVPDFNGSEKSVDTILDSGVDVFAQNLETVKRLTPEVRDNRAGYFQSLKVLSYVKKSSPKTITKTSLMLGLGESEEEIKKTMGDIKSSGVEVLTLGQYLRPTLNHLPVKKWVEPSKFKKYKKFAKDIGIKEVFSGPLVRSSYRADKISRLLDKP